jgi:hypothetical protein
VTESQAPAAIRLFGTRSLGVRLDVRLTSSQERGLAALEAYDLGQIAYRLRKKPPIPIEWIDDALLEVRRFLALQSLVNEPVPMCSATIDEVWHVLIMFTHHYAALCGQSLGRFVHHRPTAGHVLASTDASAYAREIFAAFRERYESYFGPIHPLWLLGWAETEHDSLRRDEPLPHR